MSKLLALIKNNSETLTFEHVLFICDYEKHSVLKINFEEKSYVFDSNEEPYIMIYKEYMKKYYENAIIKLDSFYLLSKEDTLKIKQELSGKVAYRLKKYKEMRNKE